LSLEVGAQLANVAAGIAIEQLGCAAVPLVALAQRLLELDVGNKIFDGAHISALQTVLRDKAVTVLQVTGLEKISASLLRAICRMKAAGASEILVWWCGAEGLFGGVALCLLRLVM